MSDLIIKIGDEALDLSSGQTIALTRQAAKVGDFVAVLADGTNEVTVPLTAHNRAILDNANIIGSDSPLPYRRTDATMVQEGYETITNGFAIVKSSADNFSLQVVGGNGGFFDLIRNLNLRDLDLSAYHHFWTNINVFNNRNNTDGFIYAVFEQSEGVGVESTMHTYGTNLYAVHTELLLPCFHVKTLVEKIFTERGYVFVTDMTGQDIYDRLLVFNGEPNRGTNMAYQRSTIGLTGDSSVLFPNPPIVPVRIWQGATVLVTDTLYNSIGAFATELNGSDKRYMLTDACRVTVRFTLIIQASNSLSTTFQMGVEATNSDGTSLHFSDHLTLPPSTTPLTITTEVSFDCGVFSEEVWFSPMVLLGDFGYLFTLKAGSTYEVTDIEFLSDGPITKEFPGSYFTGEVPVPDLKQADFLKDIAKVFQWIYDVDERTKRVTARRFDTVVENIPDAIDMSDRIDARKQKVTYGIDGFAQTNSLAYKPDDITDYDAVGYINVDDQTLKAEGKYVEVSNFAATSTRQRFDTVSALYVPIFDEERRPTNGITHRLLLSLRVTFPHNVNFNRATASPPDQPTDDLTFAYFAEAGNPDSLDFPTLIQRFYQAVKAMSHRGKTLECMINLRIKDVVNYDPFIPIYIEQHGAYFYWQKVSNYVKDKLTKCTLIRL
jgi:hypothetical protein